MLRLILPATIVAVVALFAAVSGGANAGTLVSGRIKNHSIAATKLSADSIRQVRGQRDAVGPALAAGVASAASMNLWWTPYDAQARAISGYPDTHADFEDDWTEWQSLLPAQYASCPQCIGGFASPFADPTSPVYHKIFLSPEMTTAMEGAIPLSASTSSPIWTRLDNGTQNPMDAAISIMTFIHESYHLRFVSGDEGLVNACALRDFPYWLASQFEIPATKTVTVPQTETRTKRVVRYRWKRIHHHRHRVRYYKTITYTVTVYVQQTQPNPIYQTLVTDAHTFYNSQPVPYSTGTCTEPAIS